MRKREIAEYIVEDFKPIELITSFTAVEQQVEEAIRWFDRRGGEFSVEQFSYDGGRVLQLPDRVDQVFDVKPDRVVTEIFTAQTLLLGVTILDYDINTLAMKQTHLSDLRTFLASRFRWQWVKPYLHIAGMNTGVSGLAVWFLVHYDWTDDEFNYIGRSEEFIIRYARALVKQKEGRALRLGSVIQSPLDGEALMSEGQADVQVCDTDVVNSRPFVPLTRTF